MNIPGVAVFIVLLVIPLLILVGRLREARLPSEQTYIVEPIVAWSLLLLSTFALATILFVSVQTLLASQMRDPVPLSVVLGAILFLVFVLAGIYYKTLVICVDTSSLRISSAFGHRTIALSDIGSVNIESNGRWRTLDVKNLSGKRLLRVTSSLRGFDDLADQLTEQSAKRIK